MASSTQLSHLPLQALRSNLINIATGCRVVGQYQLSDSFDFSPEAMWRTATGVVRSASPSLERTAMILAPFAILGYGIYNHVWKGFGLGQISEYIRSYLAAEITVPSDHHMYHQVLDWMAGNGVDRHSRSIKLHGEKSSSDSDSTVSDQSYGSPDSKRAEELLTYVPTAESTRFRFKNHTLWLNFPTPNHDDQSEGRDRRGRYRGSRISEPDVRISSSNIFRGMKIVKEFLEHIRLINETKSESKLRIHRLSGELGEVWDHNYVTRPIRSLDHISLDAAKKRSLVEDIRRYLSPERRSWYSNRGIPWRRGYLFYGPPGTGKTSVCTALAGHFNLDLYILSLSNPRMDDRLLGQCFDHLPTRCLVLMEDVDSAGVIRESSDKPAPKQKSALSLLSDVGVTLSGLLNTIDGPVSHEGRVLVMTTNSPDSLDQALLRPGRIDKKVLFGNASTDVARQLFMNTYGKAAENESQLLDPSEIDLEELAVEFARDIPEDSLTPAEIQNYLLENFDDPKTAARGAEHWAERLIQTKSQGRNVEAFSGQIGTDVESSRKSDEQSLTREEQKDEVSGQKGQYLGQDSRAHRSHLSKRRDSPMESSEGSDVESSEGE